MAQNTVFEPGISKDSPPVLYTYGVDDNTDGGDTADPAAAPTAEFSIDQRVRVRPDTPEEKRGVIVEDFGAEAGYPVEVGETRVVDPSRRWAVALDDGGLEFVDTDHLAADAD